MERLGLTSMRLPTSLADLDDCSPAFADAPASLDGFQLTAWLQQARQRPVTGVEWGVMLAAVKVGSERLWQQSALQIVSLLTWAAQEAVQQLKHTTATGQGCTEAGDKAHVVAAATAVNIQADPGGDPRQQLALRNTIKLCLFFLCCIARGECGSSAATLEHPLEAASGAGPVRNQHKRAKKARGGGSEDAAAASAAAGVAVRMRRDALLAVGAIEEAIWANRVLLPNVSDFRAAACLAQATALHCLSHPLPAAGSGADRSAKALAESCQQAMAAILARPLVAAEQRQAQAAAAQALTDLLEVVAEPKQQPQVLSAAARLMVGVMDQCSKAGVAIVAHLADRVQQLAASSSCNGGGGANAAGDSAALAAQQLDACLSFAAPLVSGGSIQLQTALLLCLPQLLHLVAHPRSSTRRLMIDMCGSLLARAAQLLQQGAAAPPTGTTAASDAGAAKAATSEAKTAAVQLPAQAAVAAAAAGQQPLHAPPAVSSAGAPAPSYRALLLAAVISRLCDRDANLRAKALGCLETHVALLASHLGVAEGGAMLDRLLPALSHRLCDKSPSVRKKAATLLAALLSVRLAPAVAARLADAVLPVVSKLLCVRPESALHPGEEGAKVLSQAVLRLSASSTTAAGLLHLLKLADSVGNAAARHQLQGALLNMLLLVPLGVSAPGSAAGSRGQAAAAEQLLRNLGATLAVCSRQQVGQLRQALQEALASPNPGAGTHATVAAAAAHRAVQLCYQRIHMLASYSTQPAAPAEASGEPGSAPDAPGAEKDTIDGGLTALHEAAASLYMLGPLSSRDGLTSAAEAGLLLRGIEHLTTASRAGDGADGGSCAGGKVAGCLHWLLQSLALALRQLFHKQASFLANMQGNSGSLADAEGTQPAVAVAQEALPVLHNLLLSPASSATAVRQDALDVLFALPAAAQGQLRLLHSLTVAVSSGDAGVAAAAALLPPAGPLAQLRIGVDDHGQPLLVAADDCRLASTTCHASDDESDPAVVVSAASQQGKQQRQVQQRALLALLELLGGMSGAYQEQRAAFLAQLRCGGGGGHPSLEQPGTATHTSKAGRPLRPAAEWWVGDGAHGCTLEPTASPRQQQQASDAAAHTAAGASSGGDYMHVEDEAAKHEAAAQRLLELLLEAGDTPPACHLPLLEGLTEPGTSPLLVQAAALRSLGRLAVLSEPLCRRTVQLAERQLQYSGTGTEAVREAAVVVLVDAIDAFPNSFSSRLLLVGQLMVPREAVPATAAPSSTVVAAADAQVGESAADKASKAGEAKRAPAGVTSSAGTANTASAQHLAQAAAAAYCRLMLQNKLKLQGVLGPVGEALACGSPPIATLVSHALGQMLSAAAGLKERARLCLDLFHQTPVTSRHQLAEVLGDPASGLLSEADLRSDVLTSQAVQAVLAAAGTAAAGPAEDAAVLAAAHLLRNMQPSSKVLAALATQLQAVAGGGSGAAGTGVALLCKLPVAARQALRAFVSNHVPAASAGGEGDADGAADGGRDGAAGHKRKRATAGTAGKGVRGRSSASLQQQLLQLLAGGGGGGGSRRAGRPPRPAATTIAVESGLTTASACCTSGGKEPNQGVDSLG